MGLAFVGRMSIMRDVPQRSRLASDQHGYCGQVRSADMKTFCVMTGLEYWNGHAVIVKVFENDGKFQAIQAGLNYLPDDNLWSRSIADAIEIFSAGFIGQEEEDDPTDPTELEEKLAASKEWEKRGKHLVFTGVVK